MMSNGNEWFEEWFNSPYYHLLYRERNFDDARRFIDKLNSYLSFKPDQRILDLACGRGRHSVYLNNKGLNVTGIDLSENSIDVAKTRENDRLHFYVHDMRLPLPGNFDVILNLFTSFGYFNSVEEHMQVLKQVSDALIKRGYFVLDYLNVQYVRKLLPKAEEKTIADAVFSMTKYESDGYIVKDIKVEHGQKHFNYIEKVRSFDVKGFLDMFKRSGLTVCDCFGSYYLEPFDPIKSQRLIFICQKQAS